MSNLEENEYKKLRLWFLDLDYERWDEQIEQDIEDGKLEVLAQEAMLRCSTRRCSTNSRRMLRVAQS
jgi:hypothetical protein